MAASRQGRCASCFIAGGAWAVGEFFDVDDHIVALHRVDHQNAVYYLSTPRQMCLAALH